jgi:TonB-dependent receptor
MSLLLSPSVVRRGALAAVAAFLGLTFAPLEPARAAEPAPAAAPAAEATSILTGRVSNAATGNNLQGAVVRLEGTPYETLTERGGEFALRVPAGDYSLVVTYTGLDAERTTISVPRGARVRRDIALTADIYKMNPFTVTGEREGNALAITLQRESLGVRNIVSTDAFGALAGNPADLLMRLPGVEGTSTSGDTRYIRIRGMHESLSSVTVDGNRVASANGAGTDRVMEFHPTGADSIERIEVVKSPTPDMDGDSIGGAVNMVSKSAFDRAPGRRITGSVGGIWRPLGRHDPIHENFTFSYSEVFGGRLGVAFNFASRVHGTPEDINNAGWQTLANGVTGPRFNSSFSFENLQYYDRSGLGGGLKLDYKLQENQRVYVNLKWDRYEEHAFAYGGAFSTTASLATVDAAGNPTGGGGILPGYNNQTTVWRGNSTLANGTPLAAPSALNTYTRTTERKNTIAQVTIGGEHRFPGLLVDWNGYQSRAKVGYPGNKRFDLFTRGFGLQIDRLDEPYYPYVRQTSGRAFTDIASYDNPTSNTYTINLRKTAWDQYRGFSANAKKDFATVVPSSLKIGYRYRGQQRDGVNTAHRGNYIGRDGVIGLNPATGLNDDNLAQFVLPLNDPAVRYSKRYDRYPRLPFPRRMGFADGPRGYNSEPGFNIDTAFQRNPELFRDDIGFNIQQNLEGFTRFAEDINAVYLQGDVQLGKLGILAGVRVERTETFGRGAGATITAEERARRAAWVGLVTDAELRRRTIAQYGTLTEAGGEYQNVLPGVHFRYRPARNVVARLGYATNIGRPDIGNLIARTTANPDNFTVSANNPSLKPQTSDNFDFSIEYYVRPAGVISAGVFLKEMKNFIFTQTGATIGNGPDNGFDGDYAGYILTTKVNGGSAKIKGFEFNFSQQFTFLPGWLGGFGAFANYTRLDAEGNYSTGNTVAVAPTAEVAGFNPQLANLGVSYIRNKVSFRVQFSHRDRFLVTYNPTESAKAYARKRNTIDLKSGYQISKHFDVYLNIDNVLNEYDRALELFGGFPTSVIRISPIFHFGVNARF